MKEENLIFTGETPYCRPVKGTMKNRLFGDINSGNRYIDAWKLLCINPRDILACLQCYIDQTHVDVHGKFKLEPFTWTLGIFHQFVREDPRFWRSFGSVSVDDGKGRYTAAEKMIDYHEILEVLLEGYVDVQNSEGIAWKIPHRGTTFDVVLKFCFLFIAGDTAGHDKLCGKYSCRGNNRVQSICRYCDISTEHLDDPDEPYKLRTEAQFISAAKSGFTSCQEISVHPVNNAFWKVNFCGTNTGVYGSTPAENLHMIQQGLHQYLREALYGLRKPTIEVRKKSTSKKKPAPTKSHKKRKSNKSLPVEESGSDDDQKQHRYFNNVYEIPDPSEQSSQGVFTESVLTKVDVVSQHFIDQLRHQSLRDIPRTSFSQGITKNHAMLKACEECGFLLLTLLVMSSSAGSEILVPENRTAPMTVELYSEFLGTIERMMCLEELMKSREDIRGHSIQDLIEYIPLLMDRFKRTLNRTKGMKLKIVKFHMLRHLVEDMMKFGIPANYSSGPGESRHKNFAKRPAKNVQKRMNVFDFQSASRNYESLVIDKASQDVFPLGEVVEQQRNEDAVAAVLFNIDDSGIYLAKRRKTKRRRTYALHQCPNHCRQGMDYLKEVLIDGGCVTSSIEVFGELKKGGSLYRAHPNFQRLGNWYDWAIIRWPDAESVFDCYPSRISCLFRITDFSKNAVFPTGQVITEPGIFVLVQSWTESPFVDDDNGIPHGEGTQHEELKIIYSGTLSPDYWVARIEWIDSPCAVVSDVMMDVKDNTISETGKYSMIQQSSHWSNIFLRYAHDQL
jgi:hypothetical protein